MSPLLGTRPILLAGFAFCLGLMLVALYLEHVKGLIPCPLCLVQRGFFILAGMTCLIAALHNPAAIGRRIYAVLLLLFAALGAAAAGRQIWLQSLPPEQLAACLPPLDFMLEVMPFTEVIGKVLHGTADCAKVDWTLFGLSIADWSLLAFCGLIGLALYQLLRRTAP